MFKRLKRRRQKRKLKRDRLFPWLRGNMMYIFVCSLLQKKLMRNLKGILRFERSKMAELLFYRPKYRAYSFGGVCINSMRFTYKLYARKSLVIVLRFAPNICGFKIKPFRRKKNKSIAVLTKRRRQFLVRYRRTFRFG